MTTRETEQGFTLPSQTAAPSKRGNKGTADDPGHVPGVTYDQYGRYLIPAVGGDPGELVPWTRVTTLAGAVTSQEGLRVYTERLIARGFGLRADVRELITSKPDDVATQDEALTVAKEAAGVGAAARGGTARHSLLEHWARTGELRMDETEPAGRDLLAAVQKLAIEQVRPDALEVLVVNEHLGYAGRLDQLGWTTLPDGRVVLRILDAKFGKQVTKPYSRHQIGVQLALYVNATHIYDPATRTFSPMPAELDRSTGYVLHVHDGRAELHEVDLIVGWQDAKTAILMHAQRKASITFLPIGQPVVVEDPRLTDLRTEVTAAQTGIADSTAAQAGIDRMAAPDITREAAEMNRAGVDAQALLDLQAPFEPERSPSGRAKRACSKCRQPGHTAKSCKEEAPADAQDAPQPVAICPHANGWTQRVSDGAWVCGDCGRPSEATVDAMRTGAPLPVAVENGATVARLDPAPTAPAVPALPPWSGPAPSVPPTLLQRIEAVGSQVELGELWQECQADWIEEHTAAAQGRVTAGLPTR